MQIAKKEERVRKIKKAIKITAAGIAVGGTVYAGHAMNEKITKDMRKHFRQIAENNKITSDRFLNSANSLGFDPVYSDLKGRWNNIAMEKHDIAFDYMLKAKQKSYPIRDKVKYAKILYSR